MRTQSKFHYKKCEKETKLSIAANMKSVNVREREKITHERIFTKICTYYFLTAVKKCTVRNINSNC